MSNVTINPAWLRWTSVENEGGEGYNPHPKWMAKGSAPAVAAKASTENRMLRDERGNLIPAGKLAARLESDSARLATLSNDSARKITQAAIDFAKQQLAA